MSTSRSETVKSFHQGAAFGDVLDSACTTEDVGSSAAEPFQRAREDVGDIGGREGEEGGNLTGPLMTDDSKLAVSMHGDDGREEVEKVAATSTF